MNKILSKSNLLITEKDGKYWLNIYQYIDELIWTLKRAYEKEEISSSMNVLMTHILNLLQILNPKGVSVEVSEEMLKE